jgi:signal transduction histidine kinase
MDYGNFPFRKIAAAANITRDHLIPSGLRGHEHELFKKKHYRSGKSGSEEKNSLDRYEEAIGALLTRLTFVRDQERQKIANELHDQIGQNLALAKMRLGALKGRLPKKYLALVEEVGALIDHTIKDTRSLIHGLCPQLLGEMGLEAALSWLVEQIQVKYGLPCSLEITSLPRSLSQEVQVVIFQAVRELLINAAKHAHAHRVKVICACEEGFLRIQVLDDGQGFDDGRDISQSEFGRFGLFSIRARLAPLGGNLDIDSRVGAGSRVSISVPLSAN